MSVTATDFAHSGFDAWRSGAEISASKSTCRYRAWTSGLPASPWGTTRLAATLLLSSCAAGWRGYCWPTSAVTEIGSRTFAGQLRDLMRKNIEVADQRRFVTDMNCEFEAGIPKRVVRDGLGPVLLRTTSRYRCQTPAIRRRLFTAIRPDDRSAWTSRRPKTGRRKLRRLACPGAFFRIPTTTSESAVWTATTRCFASRTPSSRPSVTDGSPLGMRGFAEIVAAATPYTDGANLMARLLRSVRALHSENLHQDDATLLLFRPTGVRLRLRDQGMAPFRLLFPGLGRIPRRRPASAASRLKMMSCDKEEDCKGLLRRVFEPIVEYLFQLLPLDE